MSIDQLELTKDDLETGDQYYTKTYQKRVRKFKQTVSIVSLIRSIFGQVLRSSGQFWKISFPIELVCPQSALEYFSCVFTPTNEFLSVGSIVGSTAIQRMKKIVTWLMNNNRQHYATGFIHTKPYNPVLGEIFSASWKDMKNGSSSYLLCEQVNHQPPISSYHFTNPEMGIQIDSSLTPKSKLYFNSGTVGTTGKFLLSLKIKETGETERYSITHPQTLASGVFYGQRKVCPYGKCLFECHDTKIKAVVDYKTNYSVKGKISDSSGKVFCSITSRDARKNVEFQFSSKKYTETVEFGEYEKDEIKMNVKSVRDLSESHSRRKWLKCTKNIILKNYKFAQAVKFQIESFEIERMKKLCDWKPRFFDVVNGNSYVCNLEDNVLIQKHFDGKNEVVVEKAKQK